MNELKLNITTANAAFDNDPEFEVARILKKLASAIEYGERPETLLDINGNAVGHVIYS